ncbi:MAG: electron transport complex subunit E [Lachnospiraceae bacterium]|nr:electron transport complex subunit E [Lachnospiraceae bacterium]
MMKTIKERLFNGIIKENPVLILMLGMCPTLAVTTSATNGFGMGVATMAVLIVSNLVISALRKYIPDNVRLPAYIVIVASFVTLVELLTQAYVYDLYKALGIYIPLIVVNCIILGRAEAFASKNGVFASVMDGIGMGIGFTIALTIIGLIREFIGVGSVFGLNVLPESYPGISVFVKAPGGFLIMAVVIAIMNACKIKTKANKMVEEGCDGACATCSKAENKAEDCASCPSKADCKEAKGGDK